MTEQQADAEGSGSRQDPGTRDDSEPAGIQTGSAPQPSESQPLDSQPLDFPGADAEPPGRPDGDQDPDDPTA